MLVRKLRQDLGLSLNYPYRACILYSNMHAFLVTYVRLLYSLQTTVSIMGRALDAARHMVAGVLCAVTTFSD
jgi:hypothetical protein